MSSAARYERLKAAWMAANPEASSAEYQDAMRAIARKAGL
jgi:hypothetical protein